MADAIMRQKISPPKTYTAVGTISYSSNNYTTDPPQYCGSIDFSFPPEFGIATSVQVTVEKNKDWMSVTLLTGSLTNTFTGIRGTAVTTVGSRDSSYYGGIVEITTSYTGIGVSCSFKVIGEYTGNGSTPVHFKATVVATF